MLTVHKPITKYQNAYSSYEFRAGEPVPGHSGHKAPCKARSTEKEMDLVGTAREYLGGQSAHEGVFVKWLRKILEEVRNDVVGIPGKANNSI